ncbi:hypothetical protein TVAG_242600 [Trichomonas vaginalis G3]|uniref:VPS9 domain-containing protein n=1 Tax=Trichomonas vaginalis (strain ATCC PRA-98 / G3) TaxID=412133 RepID=A2G3U1_TRIV3|nr:VPS9 domain family [Trichomonas vaginalis G3]EAX88176.1 hypothetical protein TVAG_242600 [Trichomonas vaginalis G3]KAI5522689.1 VPS9 domain family [Trichomonas vaginalis G3]|eukprot:XP_001301106.1 hypothetical protein [Trichomonas vaginalis G3]
MRTLYSILTRGLKNRIENVLKEITILDQQIPYFATAPGFHQDIHLLYTHLRNVKATLSDLMMTYLTKFEKSADPDINISKALKLHLEIFNSHEFMILSRELLGHHSSIATIIGNEYEKITKNLDEATDAQLRMVSLIFPYEFVLNMLADQKFLKSYMSFCLKYTTINNTYYINEVFKLIQVYHKAHSDQYQTLYFTPDAPMFFELAEHLIGLFNSEIMIETQIDKLTDFQILQKCMMISKSGPQTCGLNENLLNNLLNHKIERIDVHYLRSTMNSLPDITYEPIDIPALQHISFELRKTQLQCCPTEMLHCIANTLKWISDALTAGGKAAGADEIFQFYVYIISSTHVICIQTLINFMETYVYEGLRETKYPFLISQTKIALDFIDARMIAVEPYLLFPFKYPPERMQNIIKLADDNPVFLTGFEVIAFPTFSFYYENFFPSLIYYTGNDDDNVKAYKYKVTDGFNLISPKCPNFENVATVDGTFFQLSNQEDIDYIIMDQKVPGPLLERINLASFLMKNLEKIPNKPRFSLLLEQTKNIISDFGKDGSSNPCLEIRIIIAEIQKSLVILNFLPAQFHIDGTFSDSTVLALQKYLKNSKNFVINKKIYFDLIKFLSP